MNLVLQGGRVLDPAEQRDGVMDIRIEDGTIREIRPGVSPEGAQLLPCAGRIVTPGLIDSHAHVFEDFSFTGIDPDILGVGSAVTTVVDAGSSGAASFAAMRRYIMGRAKTNVLAFMNLATYKLGKNNELAWPWTIDDEANARVVEANLDRVVGIKLRACPSAVGDFGLEPLKRARALGEQFGLPIMVHIGEQELHDAEPIPIRDVVKILRPGDIVTHLFTGHPGGVLDANGRLQPDVREAFAAGLRFDLGHGLFNMSFDTAARVLDQGIEPHTISTDGHKLARQRLVHDLPTVMAKMLAIGFTLPQLIQKATYEVAKTLHRPELAPGIAIGRPALLSVIELREVDWEAEDSMGQKIAAKQQLRPVMSIRGSEIHQAVPWEG